MSDFINTSDILGDDELMDRLIQKTITEYADNRVITIGATAFSTCMALVSIDIPSATYCTQSAFSGCHALKAVNLPAVQDIELSGFADCYALEKISLPSAMHLYTSSFKNCSALVALILPGDILCGLMATNVFSGTPIGDGTGYIYVPAALLSDTDATMDYRQATNWSTYAAQFRALEDYTVDGTTTGELDETKIAA